MFVDKTRPNYENRFLDDSEKFCGSNGETLPFYSAYVLDDINSTNTDDVPDYKYFQCVTQQLYNDFSEVLPAELVLF
jgi:hypothetical protein